jgi:hypothetical protein
MMFYSPELIDLSVINLNSEIIQDLEIVSQSALERVIKNWLNQSQIEAKTLAIYLVEENYFFKDFADTKINPKDPEVKSFLENIPFNHIVTRAFPMQGGVRIAAINLSLLKPLITVFEDCGFTVLAATPAFVFGINSENPFSKELAKKSLENQDIFKAYNFLDQEEVEKKLAAQKSFLSVEINKNLIFMIVFLLVLIGILIILLINR